MTRSQYRFGEDHYPHFMTATVVAWLPALSYPCFVEIVLNSWRFLQQQRNIDILAFVIMVPQTLVPQEQRFELCDRAWQRWWRPILRSRV